MFIVHTLYAYCLLLTIIRGPVSQTSCKVAPDQFGFIVNLETLCSELKKDVSLDVTVHREVHL